MSTFRSKYARNLGANWIAHGANIAVMFFLSPFILHTLGQVEYGIWSLLTVLTGYMGVCDLGVRTSTGRHVTMYLGRGDHSAVGETIRTSIACFSFLGILAVVTGLCVGWLFPSLFKSVPSEFGGLAQLLLPLMALGLWMSLLGSVFASVLTAHDRFDLARAVDLVILVLRVAVVVLVLSLGFGLIGLVAVALGRSLLSLVGNYVLARRTYPELVAWPPRLYRDRLRELLGYGLAASVSVVSLHVIGQTDLVITGAAIDVEAVTVYSVGAMAVLYSGTFLRHIYFTLFPPIQRAVARNDIAEGRWLFLRAGRGGLIFGVLVYVGMIVFAEPFIRLWMYGPGFGEEAVRHAAVVMGILAASRLPLLFVGAGVQLLNAMGHVRLTAAIGALEAVVKLALSVVFVVVFGWGLVGVAAGTVVGRLLVGTFIVPWQACLKVNMSWRKYLVEIGGRGMLVGLLMLAWCLLVRQIGPANTWASFFVQVALATAGYGVLALWLVVPVSDRQRIWQRLSPRERARRRSRKAVVTTPDGETV